VSVVVLLVYVRTVATKIEIEDVCYVNVQLAEKAFIVPVGFTMVEYLDVNY
jgi:hypothetical protein